MWSLYTAPDTRYSDTNGEEGLGTISNELVKPPNVTKPCE